MVTQTGIGEVPKMTEKAPQGCCCFVFEEATNYSIVKHRSGVHLLNTSCMRSSVDAMNAIRFEWETKGFKCYLLFITKNPILQGQMKHIDTRFHFIHGLMKDGIIQVKYWSTKVQLAYVFTKALARVNFDSFVKDWELENSLIKGSMLEIACH